MVHQTIVIVLVLLQCTSHVLGSETTVPPPDTSGLKITVDVSSSKYATDVKFLSVTVGPTHIGGRWLGSQKLRNVAAALAPCDVRVGGTRADFLVFKPNNPGHVNELTYTENYTLPGNNMFNRIWAASKYYVTGQQWSSFNTFLSQVKWDLLFDLNVFLRKGDSWDPSNANLLLNYSAQRGINIPYFQLGNEPYAFKRKFNITVSPETLVSDLKILRNLLSQYPMYSNSRLCGPDAHTGSAYFERFVAVGASEVVDELSAHHYYMHWDGHIKAESFVKLSTLNGFQHDLERGFAVQRGSPRPLPLRFTETSSCSGGGCQHLSDAYVAGFLWLDKLGRAATFGVTRVFRQSFTSAAYGLITSPDFPNPDYYLSVLYKRLIAGHVFSVSLNPPNVNVRVYSHCARPMIYSPGALAVYFLNVQNASAVISLAQFPDEELHLYLLTPGDAKGLQSSYVRLNGKTLKMAGDNIPDLPPAIHKGSVTVEAYTFGFIVVPNANVTLCKE